MQVLAGLLNQDYRSLQQGSSSFWIDWASELLKFYMTLNQPRSGTPRTGAGPFSLLRACLEEGSSHNGCAPGFWGIGIF